MSKETFEQMIARVTAKRTAASGGPPVPPKLSLPKSPASSPSPSPSPTSPSPSTRKP